MVRSDPTTFFFLLCLGRFLKFTTELALTFGIGLMTIYLIYIFAISIIPNLTTAC